MAVDPRLAAARALGAVLAGKASLGSSLPPLLDRVEPRDRGLARTWPLAPPAGSRAWRC